MESIESQPQNPEFRINPENFHPCLLQCTCIVFLLSADKLCNSLDPDHNLDPNCLNL